MFLDVVGHQGGWDEILMVVAPIILLFCLLKLANRRAKRR
jgi:hypothetical protein